LILLHRSVLLGHCGDIYISYNSDKAYAESASSAKGRVDDANLEYYSDAINFLGEDPCYPPSVEK